MINKKSQGSVEFMILVGIVLFFFVTFFLSIQESMSYKIEQKKMIVVKNIALSVQDEFNLALKSSDGYERTFEIPSDINGQDYIIGIQEDTVYVKTLDEKTVIYLPVANVTMINDINKGSNKITKQGGIINVNP